MTQLKFIHVGMEHMVCANRVLAIVTPQTKCAQRYIKIAKDYGRYIDASLGRTNRSVQILDNDGVVVSAVKPRTLLKRLMGNIEETEEADDEDN